MIREKYRPKALGLCGNILYCFKIIVLCVSPRLFDKRTLWCADIPHLGQNLIIFFLFGGTLVD